MNEVILYQPTVYWQQITKETVCTNYRKLKRLHILWSREYISTHKICNKFHVHKKTYLIRSWYRDGILCERIILLHFLYHQRIPEPQRLPLDISHLTDVNLKLDRNDISLDLAMNAYFIQFNNVQIKLSRTQSVAFLQISKYLGQF